MNNFHNFSFFNCICELLYEKHKLLICKSRIMSCLQKIIVIFGKKFKLLNTLLTIGRNYACGQWFVMYVNTETSLVNTVQVTKDIFNTSLVSKLSARPTSLHCLVSAGLSLLILMPALLQFRNTSSSPHLQSSANTALPSRLLQVSA